MSSKEFVIEIGLFLHPAHPTSLPSLQCVRHLWKPSKSTRLCYLCYRLLVQPPQSGVQPEVLPARQERIESVELRAVPEGPAGLHTFERNLNLPPKFKSSPAHFLELGECAAAVDECLSGGGPRVAGQHLEGRRLARPVHPEQPEALALPHAEGQPGGG